MSHQWFGPSQTFGKFCTYDLTKMKEDLLDKSGDVSKATNRVVVTDSGEAKLLPDIANVFISYKSLKVYNPLLIHHFCPFCHRL